MKTDVLPLVVGLPGHELGAPERRVLELVRPAGVILFARNVETPDQVRALTASLDDLEPRPFVCLDLEGGAVNRLAGLWGTLPSPATAARAGRRAVRALGEAAGAACRALGVHLDLAPVVDLSCPEGMIARECRSLGDDPERVVTLAGLFADGLEAWSVAGCLKHYPGLGVVPVDTHSELPVIELEGAELETHLAPFERLSEKIPIVMMAHVVAPGMGDRERPASLSPMVVERARRLPSQPVVLSDDLEMGALDGWGPLPERVVAALKARNDGVLVCRGFDRLEEIVAFLTEEVSTDSSLWSRIQQLAARLGTLRRELCRKASAVPAPDDATVAQLWNKSRSETGMA